MSFISKDGKPASARTLAGHLLTMDWFAPPPELAGQDVAIRTAEAGNVMYVGFLPSSSQFSPDTGDFTSIKICRYEITDQGLRSAWGVGPWHQREIMFRAPPPALPFPEGEFVLPATAGPQFPVSVRIPSLTVSFIPTGKRQRPWTIGYEGEGWPAPVGGPVVIPNLPQYRIEVNSYLSNTMGDGLPPAVAWSPQGSQVADPTITVLRASHITNTPSSAGSAVTQLLSIGSIFVDDGVIYYNKGQVWFPVFSNSSWVLSPDFAPGEALGSGGPYVIPDVAEGSLVTTTIVCNETGGEMLLFVSVDGVPKLATGYRENIFKNTFGLYVTSQGAEGVADRLSLLGVFQAQTGWGQLTAEKALYDAWKAA